MHVLLFDFVSFSLSSADLFLFWVFVQAETGRTLALTLVRAPVSTLLEQLFFVMIEVRNESGRKLELRLQMRKEKMGPIVPCGTSSKVMKGGKRK